MLSDELPIKNTNKYIVTWRLLDNSLHREDGPAIEWADGDISWYLYGDNYSFEDYVKVAGWSDEQVVMYKLEHG